MASQLVTRGLGIDGLTVNEVTGGLGGFVPFPGGGMGMGMPAWTMFWRWFLREYI